MSDYLQIMGIECWKLQAEKTQRANNPVIKRSFCYYLGSVPVGVLIASGEKDNAAQRQLIEAIAKAMRQPFKGEYCETKDTLPQSVNVLIFFGEEVAEQWQQKPIDMNGARGKIQTIQGKKILVTHSLQALLADQSLKAQTWHDLRSIIPLLSA